MDARGYAWYEDESVVWKILNGLCHVETPQQQKPVRKNHYNIEKMQKDAMICLTCTKENCNGDKNCFLRRKNELENKEK